MKAAIISFIQSQNPDSLVVTDGSTTYSYVKTTRRLTTTVTTATATSTSEEVPTS